MRVILERHLSASGTKRVLAYTLAGTPVPTGSPARSALRITSAVGVAPNGYAETVSGAAQGGGSILDTSTVFTRWTFAAQNLDHIARIQTIDPAGAGYHWFGLSAAGVFNLTTTTGTTNFAMAAVAAREYILTLILQGAIAYAEVYDTVTRVTERQQRAKDVAAGTVQNLGAVVYGTVAATRWVDVAIDHLAIVTP